jgi:dTDP-4-amino-4,6-dideoxygalactose transaminase
MFGSKKICKIAEKYTSRGLWLPSSIGLSNHEIDFICDVIIKFFKK